MTSTAQLIERVLGRSLRTYVQAQQMQGMGWRRIAEQVEKDTGIAVSHESLRSWFPDLRAPAKDRAA